MRKSYIGLVVFAVVACFVLNAAAQEQPIDRFELDKIMSKAEMGMRTVSHRVVTTNETFRSRDGKQKDGSVSTREFVLPDRRRTIFEIRPPWSPVVKDESIFIGDVQYTRSGDGPWKLVPPSTTGKKDPWPAFVSSPLNTVAKFVERTMLDGQKVDVYEAVSTVDAAGTPVSTTTNTIRYWMREDGLCLKKVAEGENVQRQYFKRQTWVYEYIPKLKIEAPTGVVKPKQ